MLVWYFVFLRRVRLDRNEAAKLAVAAMLAGYAAGSLPFRGFQSLGAFTGAILGGLAWMLWRGHLRRDWLEVAGAGSFALPFAWIFVRMGCVVERAHAGALSDSWLAIRYPDGSRHQRRILIAIEENGPDRNQENLDRDQKRIVIAMEENTHTKELSINNISTVKCFGVYSMQ